METAMLPLIAALAVRLIRSETESETEKSTINRPLNPATAPAPLRIRAGAGPQRLPWAAPC